MRLHEKILKDINSVGASTHMISVEADKLNYDFESSDEIRSAYLLLKNLGYIDIIFRKHKLLLVNRLPDGIVYFEKKRIKQSEFLKEFALSKISDIIVSAIVALITSLIIS